MNINYREQQFDLFPANSATLEDINKPKFLLASLTLSTENLVILAILGIMIGLFSFSLGVERGKMVAAQSLDEKVAAAWNVGGRRLASVASVPQPVVKSVSAVPVARNYSNNGMLHQRPVAVKQTSVATASPLTAGSRWTVQVSTYKSQEFAKEEALGLKAKGYPAFLIKSKDFYLVCLGAFSSQAQADAFSKKVSGKYQGSPIRRF